MFSSTVSRILDSAALDIADRQNAHGMTLVVRATVALDIADRQNAQSMTLAVRATVDIFRNMPAWTDSNENEGPYACFCGGFFFMLVWSLDAFGYSRACTCRVKRHIGLFNNVRNPERRERWEFPKSCHLPGIFAWDCGHLQSIHAIWRSNYHKARKETSKFIDSIHGEQKLEKGRLLFKHEK